MTPIMHRRQARAVSNGIFFISLGLLIYTGAWWPAILIALWLTIGSKQLLTGRLYDCIITTAILLGLFIFSAVNIQLGALIPVLFILGGIYLIFREYFYSENTHGEEPLEELKEELEETKIKRDK